MANRPKQNSILKEVVFAASNFCEFHKFLGISLNLIFANFSAKRNLRKLILVKKLNNQSSSFLNL